MTQSKNDGKEPSESSSEVLCLTDGLTAEHVRLVLALNEIRAAVIHRDPLRLAVASAEVLVAAVDIVRAQDTLEDCLVTSREDDWNCPSCGELVPMTFDLCWNCGSQMPAIPSYPPFESSALVTDSRPKESLA